MFKNQDGLNSITAIEYMYMSIYVGDERTRRNHMRAQWLKTSHSTCLLLMVNVSTDPDLLERNMKTLFRCTWVNPLTAGVAYIRVFIFYQHIKYHILNMLKIKCDINQQDLKRNDLHCVKSQFHSLEVVDRVNFKWVKIQIE